MDLVGNAWLKANYGLNHFDLSHVSYITSTYKTEVDQDGNTTEGYPKHYAPENDIFSHIEFGLKYDDLSLDFLAQLFRQIPQNEFENHILKSRKGRYERRIGFLYEFLTQNKLEIPSLEAGNYIDLIDSEKYISGNIIKDKRWKINNNLLGTYKFCPIVRRIKSLESLVEINFREKIDGVKKNFSEEVFYRAVNYLYTKETRSSYEIEREDPSPDRISRFIYLLQKAGTVPLTILLSEKHLTELQNAIVDPRFASSQFRNFQNYIGETTANYKEFVHYACPPPHIIDSIMEGLQESAIKSSNAPSIIKACIVPFGFVFAHPFEDGNGRLHRFLIHDMFTRDGIVPTGMIVPISARMLTDKKEYDTALEKYSIPLMKRLQYKLDDKGALEILNPETVESYFRYPDLTSQSIYLAKTLESSIEKDLYAELEFLYKYDDIKKAIQDIVDMPDRMVDLCIKFLHQNNGKISKKKRELLKVLTDAEVEQIESSFKQIFDNTIEHYSNK